MITKKCSQCGKEFTLTDGEIEFYNSKNLYLPKRCKECRDKNKNNNTKTQNNVSHNSQIYVMGNTANKSKNSNGFNFIRLALIIILAVVAVITLTISVSNNPISNSKQDYLSSTENTVSYSFADQNHLTSHFNKHGKEVGAVSESDYVAKANAVINNPNSLHKLEAEDNDHVYFNKSTGEIVILSQKGIIRTYFITDYDYYERQ